MTSDYFERLDREFVDEPGLVAGKPSTRDVDEIEAFVGFELPFGYRTFIERYGAAIVGPYPVFGVGSAEMMANDEESVIKVTRRYRAEKLPGTEDTLVISVDHAGNPIALNAKGSVNRYDHDSGTTEILAPAFGEFLLWCLRSAGSD
jgi:hypothetical protein